MERTAGINDGFIVYWIRNGGGLVTFYAASCMWTNGTSQRSVNVERKSKRMLGEVVAEIVRRTEEPQKPRKPKKNEGLDVGKMETVVKGACGIYMKGRGRSGPLSKGVSKILSVGESAFPVGTIGQEGRKGL